LKIAIVSSSFPPLSSGGVSSAQYGLLHILKKQADLDVKAFSFSDISAADSDSTEGIIRSGTPWLIKKLIILSCSIFFKLKDRGTVAYQTSDIFSNAVGSLLTAFKIRKFKPDIVIVSDHGAPMFFIQPFVKAKYIWVAHHNPMRFVNNPLFGNCSIPDAQFATDIEKLCTKNCFAIFSPSSYMKGEMEKSHGVFENSFVVPNYLDETFAQEIQPLRHERVLDEEYLIFIPSAGSVIKGERYTLSIIMWINSQVKDVTPVFLLSGELSKSLEYEISLLQDIKVIILGQLKYSKNIAYLKACDLCISPTLAESFGMALLEALTSVVPVVAFNVGGNADLISNGENGYLVEYLNIAELCEKALDVIQAPLSKSVIISSTQKRYCRVDIEASLISHLKQVHERIC